MRQGIYAEGVTHQSPGSLAPASAPWAGIELLGSGPGREPGDAVARPISPRVRFAPLASVCNAFGVQYFDIYPPLSSRMETRVTLPTHLGIHLSGSLESSDCFTLFFEAIRAVLGSVLCTRAGRAFEAACCQAEAQERGDSRNRCSTPHPRPPHL